MSSEISHPNVERKGFLVDSHKLITKLKIFISSFTNYFPNYLEIQIVVAVTNLNLT